MAKQELLATIRDCYRESSKKDKGLTLDEFIAVTGHRRKHGIRPPRPLQRCSIANSATQSKAVA